MGGLLNTIVVLGIIGAIFYAINEWRKNMALLRTVTDTHRGTWSERRLIVKLLKLGIPAEYLFHDLYVRKRGGWFSQVDVVAVTDVGIVVFEVKDYSGWIFGKGYQTHWTQVLAYGREKHRFYNPVKQNQGHIDALRNRLSGITDVPFYSVILFYGRCRLRDVSYIPDDVWIGYSSGVKSIMESIINYNPPARYRDKQGVVDALREAAANGSDDWVVNKHINNIHNYF